MVTLRLFECVGLDSEIGSKVGEEVELVGEHKRVVIQNSHGEKLVGILHETGARELVIICHGFRSSKDRIPMISLAAAFEKEGISAFRFDFAGNGESEGSFQYGNYRREADDLRAVVKHFRGDKRCVGAIIGHSKGGNAVLLYASRYNDIQTVVNIAGRCDLKRGIEGRLGEDFQEKIEQNGFIDVKNRRGKIEYRVTKESFDGPSSNRSSCCMSIHPSKLQDINHSWHDWMSLYRLKMQWNLTNIYQITSYKLLKELIMNTLHIKTNWLLLCWIL
ncbi:uncharacterized protein Fot_18148 [Forsythia ovata]|uniref:Serine aminopeptidase S33 domain-containing protein n=1 Tax=Forsythia ovata TaxID=205694 RepID=A0ABD1VHC5_9LAMI